MTCDSGKRGRTPFSSISLKKGYGPFFSILGGGEALFVGLNHLDRFSAVGGFSSGLRDGAEQRFPHLTSSANAKLRTLWIACGTSDGLIEANRKFKDMLAAKQITFTSVETPGAHTWMVWRRNLAAFAPLLFR